jgi:hypothetical protein
MTFCVRSNKFDTIRRHRALGRKEITSVTVGAVAGVVLLAGIWVHGAKIWRRRKSLAVDLSEQIEEGYTDDARR